MAREEIAWIIDDFKAAQLDPARNATTRDQCLTHRRSQHRWYLEALGDALSLSPVQAAEARRRLAQNFEQAASMFIASLGRSHAIRSAEETCIDTFENQTIRDLVSAGHWLFDPSIPALPWDLCDLTPKQETITWKHWHDQPSDPDDPDNSTNPNFLLPKPDCVGILSVRHLAPASLMPANQILPFLTNQNFIEASNPLETLTDISAIELIAQIRALHPSQLKILLLLKPAMAFQIEDALNVSMP